MKSILCILGLVAGFLVQSPTHGAVMTVGSDPACDFHSLQIAIGVSNTNNQDDEIRLANNLAYTSVALEKTDVNALTVVGGYPSCTANGASTILTVLDGAGTSASVVTARGGRLSLANLWIKNGTPRYVGSSGGGIRGVLPTTIIELKRVRLSGNSAWNGGGISVVGKEQQWIQLRAEDLTISENEAAGNGGGFHAEYVNGTFDGLLVEKNRAGGNGGGAWLGRDAVFHNRAGKLRSGFFSNRARESGGGIAIEGGGMEMYQVSRGLEPPVIEGNEARVGGGVYVFNDKPGTLAAFNGHEINVRKNLAGIEGGFAAVVAESDDSGNVYAAIRISADAPPVGGGSFANCAQPLLCNVFGGNAAIDDDGNLGLGGLVSVRSEGAGAVGFVSFNNVTVTGNLGHDLAHISANKENEFGRRVEFFNSLIDHNTAEKNLIVAEGFSQVFIGSSTATENWIGEPIISGAGDIYVRGSIFTDDMPLLNATTPQTSVFNLIVANDDGLAGYPMISKTDPRFVAPSQRDYALRSDSPALDMEAGLSISQFDRNSFPRDVDLLWVPDINTPRDLGCFERQF